MKNIFFAIILSLFSFSALASTCNLVLPFPPGGSGELYGRIFEKHNNNITLHFKPGAYSTVGVSSLEKNKSWFMLGVPNMFSDKNPNKNPNVELVKVLFYIDTMIITSKDISFKNIIEDKVNIGIPLLGHTHHATALYIKEKNEKAEVIPFGGDAKALPSLLEKDIDAYVISSPIGNEWIKSFPQLKVLANIPYGSPFVFKNIKLESVNFFGVFVHKDASSKERDDILKCISDVTLNPKYYEDFNKIGLNPKDFNDNTNTHLEKYLSVMRKVGL
jgi:hypothetical protein